MIASKQIRLKLLWVTIVAWSLILFTSCTKNYKCSMYRGSFEVKFNHKRQSCYYSFKGNKVELRKEQCASLCYEY